MLDRSVTLKNQMVRSAIPAELARAVHVEAGHRCAIPRCGHSNVDVHHIVPWSVCKEHKYSNLISLCPNCHRRAHRGEIDATSLRNYKRLLMETFRDASHAPFTAPVVEVKRRLSDSKACDQHFDFEFPEFFDPGARIASKNIEAWGNELLIEFQNPPLPKEEAAGSRFPIAWLTGRYELARRDRLVVSVRYEIQTMYERAAHRGTETRAQNFLLDPFMPLTMETLVESSNHLGLLVGQIRASLLGQYEHLEMESIGTDLALLRKLACFTIGTYGLEFYFDEYTLACYALGRHAAFVPFDSLRDILVPELHAAFITSSDGH